MEATLARTGYLCVIWQITEQITAICGVIELAGPGFVWLHHLRFRDLPTLQAGYLRGS